MRPHTEWSAPTTLTTAAFTTNTKSRLSISRRKWNPNLYLKSDEVNKSKKRSVAIALVPVMCASIMGCRGHTSEGSSREPSPEEQAALFERSERGDAKAQCNLASLYYLGKGVPQDYARAAGWYMKAADQGYAKAQSDLGVMYYRGTGVPKDDVEAVRWYRKAAEQGYPSAEFNLGLMYQSGRGVARDETQAVRWYRSAADQGDASAGYALGTLYRLGLGVPVDSGEAAKWYRKAAKAGNRDAMYALMQIFWNRLRLPLRGRWSSLVAILLGLVILTVPTHRWGRSAWLLSALMSAMFAAVTVRELSVRRWPVLMHTLLIILSMGGSALFGFIAFRELRHRRVEHTSTSYS